MQYVPNLGETPGEDARRDAVHVPVAPVVAGMDLQPGWHVGFGQDGLMYNTDRDCVGVVDPFIKEMWIPTGTKFWLFLYPNSVTSLRHVWTSPHFKVKVPGSDLP
jgi:hypothetical protein